MEWEVFASVWGWERLEEEIAGEFWEVSPENQAQPQPLPASWAMCSLFDFEKAD